MSSDTPKKKAPAKKAATAKKKAPAKKQGAAKRGRPPKAAAYKANAKDGDGDGLVQDGTEHERPLRDELEERAAEALGVFTGADSMVDKLQEEALELADKIDDAVDDAIDSVVIFAENIKKKSLRDRMLKWFKRSKKK
jgi:hypothetical protein